MQLGKPTRIICHAKAWHEIAAERLATVCCLPGIKAWKADKRGKGGKTIPSDRSLGN